MICERHAPHAIRAALGLAVMLLSGCVLDRTGKFGACPEGDLVCTVSEKDYAFDSEGSAYSFEGRCSIRRADGGSEFGDPLVQWKVRGQYDRQTFEFAEAAEFSGQLEGADAAVTGISTKDPWVFPDHPVAVKNYAGDPNGLATAFCVDGIPPKYSRIPFTRNVILYMMSNHERLLMAKASSEGKDDPPSPPPPAPPCPPHYVTSPPHMDMPKPDLVYPEHVDGVTVYLTSQCGAPQVDYTKSRFQVVFEHFDDGWQEFRDFQVPLSYSPQGGSISSHTLPLGKTGYWRVKARQAIYQKHSDNLTIGEFGPWVAFRIGPPVYTLSQVLGSEVPRAAVDSSRFERINRRFEAARTSAAKPLQPADKKQLQQVPNEGRSLFRGVPTD